MEKILWYTLPPERVFKKLKTSKSGLIAEEVKKRLKKFGYNKLPEEKKASGLVILLNQFKSPLVYVLLGAAIISFFLQDLTDTAIILVAVFINTILGFYQENKANRAITYLRKLIDLKAKVLRNNNEIEISAKELVPGDIIFLEAGDKIPADARLIRVDNFQVVEAALTGESVPSDKNLKGMDRGTPLADRENMVYSGTIVSHGRAKAVVCETGIDTELGQITKLVQETEEEKTPLQQQLASFSKILTYTVVGICFLIIIIGRMQGRPIFGFGQAAREGMLNTAAAIAVAAIPEGLLIAVTAILSIGMQAILKRKALVRKLIAAETLGNVSIICTDKTGTLTEGKMQVAKIITLDEEVTLKNKLKYEDSGHLKDHDLILKISLLCNDAIIENPGEELEKWKILGAPTETALLLAAIQAGIPLEQVRKQQPRLAEIPFDSEIKYMATLNKLDEKRNVIYVKGAPEKIIVMSKQIRINGKKKPLSESEIKYLKANYEKLTNQGLRLLAFAYKQISSDKETSLEKELSNLIFIGFIALKDPLRSEAKETFQLTRQAGIRPIIVTGDHKLTAKAVVSELGLKVEDKNILEGEDLDRMSDDELLEKVKSIDIYARVEPKHKLRIINAWQKKGEVVAMTGDGVNDAPAIKAADIGIAFGSGTDVAKETSDMILLDNNFKTIVMAVERGRIIFDNIKKVILYLLSDSFSEIILISGSLILGLPLPVLPAQIIWVNLIDDGLPNIAMTFEKGEKEVMKDKPRKKSEKILNTGMKKLLMIISITTNLVLFTLFYLLFRSGYEINYIRTFIFTALGIDSLFYVFACRSLRHTIFSKNPFSNKFLIIAVIFGLILQLAAIYEPHLQRVFETVPLNFEDWMFLIALGIFNIIVIETAKHYLIIKDNNKLINA
nr:hypothetical protein [uncultured bacterium]